MRHQRVTKQLQNGGNAEPSALRFVAKEQGRSTWARTIGGNDARICFISFGCRDLGDGADFRVG
jgi:hypothetical protein